MSAIPRAAFVLTALGVVPFLFGALIALGLLTGPMLGYTTGAAMQLAYGKIILSFMGGCLWGFGAKSAPTEISGYVLSVLPALWAFLFVGTNLWLLALGFLCLLALDFVSFSRNHAPNWWINLRLPVTIVVLACLIAGALAS